MARSRCTQSARKRPAAEVDKPKRVRVSTERSKGASSAPAKRRQTESAAPKGRSKAPRKEVKAMSRGAESAASNSPSEEAETPQGMARGLARHRGGDLGAFSFFMKRAQMEGAEASPGGFPFGLGSSSSSSSQFSPLLRDLKSEDGQKQLVALTELAEQLSFSSEEALISFPMETFIPLLVNLLGNPGCGDETTGQVMLLACRCLYNVVDILPPTARIIVGHGGLSVLCANLLNIEYIDVAELTVSTIELISEDQPVQVLKAGGLQAILTFLDFFQISVQRQAANAAALMLQAVTPPDVFEQHVKPVLPTLAQLLQHSDPQVLHSICECWRRVIDGCIAAHERPKEEPSNLGSLVSRFAAEASLRLAAEKRAEEEDDDDDDDDDEPPIPPPAVTETPAVTTEKLSASLQDMCPSAVLSNLLLLLGNGISSANSGGASVLSEVLYILSVLTNYSHEFAQEVLQQDICSLVRQMLLGMDVVGGVGSAQSSGGLIRVLGLVASVLPSVLLTESGCMCEERRMAVFRQHPDFLDALSDAMVPMLLDICQASMDPSVQSICISLLLTFVLCGQERPQLLRKNLDPVHLASFLASLLLTEPSTSVTLSCLLITERMLEHHYSDYLLNFVRQGVLHAVQNISERDEAKVESADVSAEKAEAATAEHEPTSASSSTGCLRKLRLEGHLHCVKMGASQRRNCRSFTFLQLVGLLLLFCLCPRGFVAEWHNKAPEKRQQHLRSLPEKQPELSPAERPFWQSLSAAACALMLAVQPVQAFEDLNPAESLSVELFQKNTPGVVFITNEVFKLSQSELQAVPKGTGSGWVYDDEGHIVTNYHVIEQSSFVTVKFIEGTEVVAKVVGADPYSDVAVLKVDLPASRQSLLRPLAKGMSANLRVGQEVFAIGNPFGLDHTLTKGIVSGVGRTIQSVGGRPIQGAIQTDASINPGNSGGPLLNSKGQVIGMNTAVIAGATGTGFAIPEDTVSARVGSILKFGYVKRAGLGLYLGQDGLAQRLSGRPGGVVAGLQINSAAGKAGVKPGDILQEIDSRRITTVNDIYAVLDEHQPGDMVKVRLLRPDKPEELGLPESKITFTPTSLDVMLLEVQEQGQRS